MATSQLSLLFLDVVESLKALLTSPSFGTEYELLSAELSAQLLRLDLWADGVGLATHGATPSQLSCFLLDRPDFNETATHVFEGIAFLLSELKELRDKYILDQVQPLDETLKDDLTSVQSAKCKAVSPPAKPHTFGLRARSNQRQKSIYAIFKWTILDERRFSKKVKRLGCLISSLEDVARSARLSARAQTQPIRVLSSGHFDSPPPYSMLAQASARPSCFLRAADSEGSSGLSIASDNDLGLCNTSHLRRQHLLVMERFLAGFPNIEVYPIPRALDKLLGLSEQQLTELCIDVHDELLRRQDYNPLDLQHLPYSQCLNPRRNEARRKLSTVVPSRFGHLVEDIVFELKRRYPQLENITEPPRPVTPPPNRLGSGSPSPHNQTSPPPLLQYRQPHQSTLIDPDTAASALRHGYVPPRSPAMLDQETPSTFAPIPEEEVESASQSDNDESSCSIFSTFRVGMDDPCYKVLPAALRKYGIEASWETYSLYLVYGDRERCLGLDEKPLQLFRELDREGKKPMFMLRKIGSAEMNEDGSSSPSQDGS